MSEQNPILRLPSERVRQLKAIGAAHHLSISEVIGRMIRREIADGTIGDQIPGIAIHSDDDELRIAIDDGATATYSKAVAAELAQALRSAANDKEYTVDMDRSYAVVKQGTGIKLYPVFAGPAKSLSRDLAKDLADLIEKAVL